MARSIWGTLSPSSKSYNEVLAVYIAKIKGTNVRVGFGSVLVVIFHGQATSLMLPRGFGIGEDQQSVQH